jgi:hypothetical protein
MPPLAGNGWEAGNGCCGMSSHRGAMMAVGGRLNGAVVSVVSDLPDETPQ